MISREPRVTFEIKIHNSWHEAAYWIFRSWTGERRIAGTPYHGPVYYLNTNTISRPAKTIQSR